MAFACNSSISYQISIWYFSIQFSCFIIAIKETNAEERDP